MGSYTCAYYSTLHHHTLHGFHQGSDLRHFLHVTTITLLHMTTFKKNYSSPSFVSATAQGACSVAPKAWSMERTLGTSWSGDCLWCFLTFHPWHKSESLERHQNATIQAGLFSRRLLVQLLPKLVKKVNLASLTALGTACHQAFTSLPPALWLTFPA